MNAINFLELLGRADLAYISAAADAFSAPKNRAKHFKISVLAACFCAAAVCLVMAVNFFRADENTQIKRISFNDIDEISGRYSGVLLAENLDFSGEGAAIELSCRGGGVDDPKDWESLSVSADYPDCTVVLNCSFSGKTEGGNAPENAEIATFGDVSAAIYSMPPEPGFEHVRRAVFECEGVDYELLARSNGADRVYELLERLVGTAEVMANLNTEYGIFTDVLGFNECKIKIEETAPHFFTWYFYTEIDGEVVQIAEMFGRFGDDIPKAYSFDLDGDGVNELICNCTAGDGWQSVIVYRRRGEKVERGCIRDEFYDALGALDFGPGAITERYEPGVGFVVGYYSEMPEDGVGERETETFADISDDFWHWEEYDLGRGVQ